MAKNPEQQNPADELAGLRRRIADLEKAQQIRHAGEALLASIIGGSPIPTFVIGRDHRILYWNRALEELSRIRADEVVGTNQHWRAFYSRERPCMADLLVDGALKAIPTWYTGKYIPSKLIDEAYEATDFFPELGEEGRWLRFTAAVLRDPRGNLVGVVETLEDITERRQAEEALRAAHEELESRVRERTAELAEANLALKETTEHLSLILESLPIVSYSRQASSPFALTYVSTSVREMTGFSPGQFLEDPGFWESRVHPDDRAQLPQVPKTKRRQGRSEYRFRTADGSYRWFSDYWRVPRHSGGPPPQVAGVCQDVTEEKRMRQEAELRLQQMIQTHKLTALGEVVAGVAHEINNPVSFISYNIPLLEEIWNAVEPGIHRLGEIDPRWKNRDIHPEELTRHMREIIEAFRVASNRISRVITNLKEFSRSDERSARMKPLQVAEVVQGALLIVGGQIRRTVSTIEQRIEPDLPPVLGNLQKLEQVLTNLLINAHQAMPGGRKGRITVSARSIPRLNAILLDVEDNGRGIPRENLGHLFDPFFTTRRDSGGTGLGLSISYGLVREHNGLIGVLSRPGMGSRFSVFLPVEGKTLPRILPSILCLGTDLEFLGALKAALVEVETWEARPGVGAPAVLKYLDEHPEVDIVVTEWSLPDLDGRDLLKAVRDRFPLVEVVLCAPEEEMQRLSAGDGATEILPKSAATKRLQKILEEKGRLQL
ncbi:MAG TPA: PAS domain S-box protein [Syntrophales bacterium]|nr:PAS domain S-box protein [Syntrophales bacterium]